MASWGGALAQSLAERLKEKEKFVAEQRALAQDRLRQIESTRRSTVGRAREALDQSATFLQSVGFKEEEVSQLISNNPKELLTLATRIKNDDLSADEVRTAIKFKENYAADKPLSQIIKEATPIFHKTVTPDDATREQTLFSKLFSMDVKPEMDKFYRESNFGGYSGYDILGSLEADVYRTPSGVKLIDFSAIPEKVSDSLVKETRDGAIKYIEEFRDRVSKELLEGGTEETSKQAEMVGKMTTSEAFKYLSSNDKTRDQFLGGFAPYYTTTPKIMKTGAAFFGTDAEKTLLDWDEAKKEEIKVGGGGGTSSDSATPKDGVQPQDLTNLTVLQVIQKIQNLPDDTKIIVKNRDENQPTTVGALKKAYKEQQQQESQKESGVGTEMIAP